MADWDENSPILVKNLQSLLRGIRDEAVARKQLDLETIRKWHFANMAGLDLPPGVAAGVFRGEPTLQECEVRIGRHRGTRSDQVEHELVGFETTLKRVVARLDERVPAQALPDKDCLAAVIETCAWAHSEWVRIHPFPNGSGRTARLLANALAMRYRLPPFVRLRPRPDHPYAAVADSSMAGIWAPTVSLFHRLLDDALK